MCESDAAYGNLNNSDTERSMNGKELAQYIEATDGASKPWLLVQMRLMKLQEERSSLTPEEYVSKLSDIHQDLMNLGEWWRGIEDEVF